MKQILILIALCLSVSAVKAQTTFSETMRYATSGDDTLTNADTIYLKWNGISYSYQMRFVHTLTKVSGTVAGTAMLQGSDDQDTWYNLASSNETAGVNTANGYFQDDTAAYTDATATYEWLVKGNSAYRWKYYRIRCITTGTSVAAPTGTVWYRKEN